MRRIEEANNRVGELEREGRSPGKFWSWMQSSLRFQRTRPWQPGSIYLSVRMANTGQWLSASAVHLSGLTSLKLDGGPTKTLPCPEDFAIFLRPKLGPAHPTGNLWPKNSASNESIRWLCTLARRWTGYPPGRGSTLDS